MSIYHLDNGLKVVTLGENTTNLSLVYQGDDTAASGILFAPLEFTGELKGDEVFIHIANAAGIISLLKHMTELISTWKITEGEPDEIDEAKQELLHLHKRLQGMG